MILRAFGWLAGIALAATATAAPAPAAEPPARIIVTFKAGTPLTREHPMGRGLSAGQAAVIAQRRADALAGQAGVALAAGLPISERMQVMSARGIGAAQLARRLAGHAQVESAVVDQRRRALLVPNDPLFLAGPASGRGPDVGQWYLRAPAGEVRSAINAVAAWDRVTGSAGIVVAVVDTGVLGDHLDLAGRVLPGYDMVSDLPTANDGNGRDADASDPGDWITVAEDGNRGGDFYGCGADDSSWHGTKVAGLIGGIADNGQGMAGTAFGVKILPVRVLGKCGGFDSDIQAGMRWAAGLDVPGVPRNPNPARIVNLSLGGSGSCATSGYPAVIQELLAAGTTVVAAAGNSAGHAVEVPANCDGVIAVAGLRHVGSKVGYSDLGPQIAISAPAGNCINLGENEPCLYPILSSTNTGVQAPHAGGSTWSDSYNATYGTSFAAPIVSGSLALMLSARPQLQPAELRRLIQSTARPFPTSGAGSDDDGNPITMCRPPDGTDQLQCYCSVGLCGAGMLDAAGAVQAALGAIARIDVQPATPRVGDTLQLSASGSLAGAGANLVAYRWALVANPGVTGGFVGATDAAEATLVATGEGTVTVSLTVTDDRGSTSTVTRDVVVQGALGPEPPVDPGAGGGGGGGVASAWWLAWLALAVAALRRTRR